MLLLRLAPLLVALLIAACGGDDAPDRPTQAAVQRPAASMATVPKLVGLHQAAAHRAAARAGFVMRFTGFTGKLAHGRYDVGCAKVLRQSPVAGERRPRGAQIAVIEAACRTPKTGPHGIDW
jgi:hypothetical protein